MQILASALPGFRDLRAPLAAGYMWLVFLCMLIKPDINTRPSNEVAAAVYDLAVTAGPIWIGLATGIVAYLIGSVSQAASPLLSQGMTAYFRRFDKSAGERIKKGDWGRITRAYRRVAAVGTGSQHDVIHEYEMQAAGRLYQHPTITEDGKFVNPDKEIGEKGSAARRALEAELELPATLLLGNEPMLFSEADRLKAERELRLAVVPPLFVITMYLACTQSRWWLLALIPVVVLLAQGHTRNLAFRSLMIGAVQLGVVRSQSVENFKSWVENIPAHTPEQREIYARMYPGHPDYGPVRIEIAGRKDAMPQTLVAEFNEFSDGFAYRGFTPDLFYRDPGGENQATARAISIFIDTSFAPEPLAEAAAAAVDVVRNWVTTGFDRLSVPLTATRDPVTVELHGPDGELLKRLSIQGSEIADQSTQHASETGELERARGI
ncbi:hypothetical protein [Mycolicibacterium psychrotolerans]|uniref:hypothetical protein n=1 Tax=Mycolicibacterium psychrotolerans TaxID=216929 RepID=UPI0013CFFE40|nr:hypothetical protein [Mycolicibacterium psychrotolerans]